MTASAMEVKSLDLAARTIDLTTALIKATASTGSLVKGAWEIGQWLGREKLNQYELLDCMEKAAGLVFANRNGLGLFEDIIRGLDTQPVGPLFLQQSGSLGRLMAGDPDLSWVVSTVACLFQHHRDENLVTDTLTSLIMRFHRSRQQECFTVHDTGVYNHEQTRVRAVVKKIVLSVWFNVVNTGCDTIPLPQELQSVCERGHYLDPDDFGIVTNIITTQCPSEAILQTTHLLRDVLLWLLLHYDGTIVVTVSGHVTYKVELGNQRRELEVRVKSACPEDGSCCSAGGESYEIHRHVSGKFEEFFTGHSISGYSDVPPRPGIRQKLYDIPRPYPSDSKIQRKGIQVRLRQTALSMMRWMLDVPLCPQVGFSSHGFTAQPGKQRTAEEQITISHILKRSPAMINLEWGTFPTFQAVFLDITPEHLGFSPGDLSSSSNATNVDTWDLERQLALILNYFPILEDILTGVSVECLCSECSESDRRGAAGQHPRKVGSCPKPGCLKRLALEEILLLLAHGVADGFGVSDASSISDANPIVRGMATLLIQLVYEKSIYWDTWFTVSSCVYLGCPFQQPVLSTHPAFGGTSFAAIQYGNLATVAPWLDLTKEIAVRGCFGLIGSRGRLGVITKGDNQYTQFRSVEENLAIIETENTEDTTSFCSRYKKATSLIDHQSKMDRDKSTVESDVILYQSDDRFYRLLLRIKTKSHWRIVDPSDALNGVIRMLPSTSCRHTPEAAEPPEMEPRSAMVYTMDEVLGRWPDLIQSYPTSQNDDANRNNGTFHLTNILDTHLKKNVALALSVCPTAVPNCPDFACMTCTVNYAKQAERVPLRDGESGNLANRYIINLLPRLTEQDETVQLRLLAGPTTPTADKG
ncbi:hypothetical protein F5Y05DRAFT_46689 [Hypoxylon sp. FL0543]|nr:hypothetical protein F5Y05DRAFT_46689 [Hypoxylon sp. FL0543]